MTTEEWLFTDPPNVAVFVDKMIINKDTWIYYVGHDVNDGAWQFHGPNGFADEENIKIVGLKTLVDIDKTIVTLFDLPLGWCAWRASALSPWQRALQK
jgi:hypothetical protein